MEVYVLTSMEYVHGDSTATRIVKLKSSGGQYYHIEPMELDNDK